MMKDVNSKFISNLDDRGPKFAFMWVNSQVEKEFVSAFSLAKSPSVLIFKPDSKKYILHDDATEAGISKILDKIVSGEGKFTKLKSDIPQFAKRN